MSTVADRPKRRFYRDADHPYRILERELDRLVTPESVILDAGCGRHAPVLSAFSGGRSISSASTSSISPRRSPAWS